MKKIFILFILIFGLCGCSVNKLDLNLNNIVNTTINSEAFITNKSSNGYSYYLPEGLYLLDKRAFNEKLYDGVNNYYLYVDVVGYYYQKQEDYPKNKDIYYYQKILDDEKNGSISIIYEESKYFVQFIYNYAKIEMYTTKENLENVIINCSYILKSIQYNDAVIKDFIDSQNSKFNEQQYDIFKNKADNSSFIEAINEYDKYSGSIEDLFDEENLQIADDEENRDITDITEQEMDR